MGWTKYDQSQVINLIVFLKRAKFEIVGMETIALTDVFKWASALHDKIEQELSRPPIEMRVDSVMPGTPPVKDSPDPIRLEESKPSKKSKKDG